jgi:hypothetical protein
MTQLLIEANQAERTPLVLLAYWHLQQGEPDAALPLARYPTRRRGAAAGRDAWQL